MKPLTYRESGVDIDAGEDGVRRITPLAPAANPAEVVARSRRHTGRPGQFPLRIHLLEGEPPRVVGLERPEHEEAPPG